MPSSVVTANNPGSRVTATTNSDIICQVVSNPDGTPISGSGSGTTRTASLTAAVANGSVAANCKSVSFSSSSDFAGTIAGATFGASQALVFAADGADTIGAIAYTRSAGTLYIATLT